MSQKECPMCRGTGKIAVKFGARIRVLREKAGWSQETLAKHVGVTRNQIANFEGDRSDPTPHMLIAAARIFGVTADHLLGLDEES